MSDQTTSAVIATAPHPGQLRWTPLTLTVEQLTQVAAGAVEAALASGGGNGTTCGRMSCEKDK